MNVVEKKYGIHIQFQFGIVYCRSSFNKYETVNVPLEKAKKYKHSIELHFASFSFLFLLCNFTFDVMEK